MAKKSKQEKVTAIGADVVKKLIEFCHKENIINPKITMDAEVSDGERYRLVFERLDIDELILGEDERSPVKPQRSEV